SGRTTAADDLGTGLGGNVVAGVGERYPSGAAAHTGGGQRENMTAGSGLDPTTAAATAQLDGAVNDARNALLIDGADRNGRAHRRGTGALGVTRQGLDTGIATADVDHQRTGLDFGIPDLCALFALDHIDRQRTTHGRRTGTAGTHRHRADIRRAAAGQV